ncbi:hypothetical protein ATANTOWER_029805 [Ataeniobius toweri]|uniref:Uncharacterized protein n=1 Tax=Ataeniobius toweri TaxID=208326 RepID=A0ABU7BVQ0_9TELE|nr:hypothetical protein [Ataeniobius toweri]
MRSRPITRKARNLFPNLQRGKLGYILALNLFRMVYSVMLLNGNQGNNNVTDIIYCFDVSIINLQKLQAQTKEKKVTVYKLCTTNSSQMFTSLPTLEVLSRVVHLDDKTTLRIN